MGEKTINKYTSEEHFIRVVYDYLVREYSQEFGMEPSMILKEEYSRIALDLHKDYWARCLESLARAAMQEIGRSRIEVERKDEDEIE